MFDLNRTIKLLTGALFDREATWRAYLPEAGDWQKTAMLMTVPLIVATAIIAYLLGLVMGDATLLGQFRPGLLPTLLGILASCVAMGVTAFIFSAMAGVFGGRNRFAFGLAALTLASVPGYVGQALTWLPWLGALLAIGLGIFSLVLLWKIIPMYLEVPDNKRAPHFIVSLVIAIVCMAIVSRIVAPMIYGDMARTTYSSMPEAERPGGLLADINRQADVMAAAGKATYTPPDDGRLRDEQVRNYVTIMAAVREQQAETMSRLDKLAQGADKERKISASELGNVMSSMQAVRNMGTAEMEAVLSAGGNWAEHEWVRGALFTAPRHKDSGDTGAHNYALYQKYADRIMPSTAQ